jgi:hypothetical protein
MRAANPHDDRILMLDFASIHFSAREEESKSRPCPERQAPSACLL